MTRWHLRLKLAEATGLNLFLSKTQKTALADKYEYQARIAEDAEDYQGAVGSLTRAISIFRGDERWLLKRGMCWQELEQYEKAIEDFNEALRINPDFAEALNGLGNIKSFTGDNAAAIEYYTKAIAIKPDYAIAIYNRGVSKADLGDHIGAIEDYNKTLEINPDDGDAYVNRGISKWELKGEAVADAAYRDMKRGITIPEGE